MYLEMATVLILDGVCVEQAIELTNCLAKAREQGAGVQVLPSADVC